MVVIADLGADLCGRISSSWPTVVGSLGATDGKKLARRLLGTYAPDHCPGWRGLLLSSKHPNIRITVPLTLPALELHE